MPIRQPRAAQKTKKAARDSAATPPVSADLLTLAGRIPAEILQQLSTAIQSGQWLFAIWHVKDSKIHLERTATNFPTVDLDPAVKLLSENLQELKAA